MRRRCKSHDEEKIRAIIHVNYHTLCVLTGVDSDDCDSDEGEDDDDR